jgi:hypothetical protein
MDKKNDLYFYPEFIVYSTIIIFVSSNETDTGSAGEQLVRG